MGECVRTYHDTRRERMEHVDVLDYEYRVQMNLYHAQLQVLRHEAHARAHDTPHPTQKDAS
jgi:hypothetical protein